MCMKDNERFIKLLRNVMLSDNYGVEVDGIVSKVYKVAATGKMFIDIGEPLCKVIQVADCHGFAWANDYVGCYDANGDWHDFEFVKYVKLSELLG